MKYRNQFRIAGLLVAASLSASASVLALPALAAESKPPATLVPVAPAPDTPAKAGAPAPAAAEPAVEAPPPAAAAEPDEPAPPPAAAAPPPAAPPPPAAEAEPVPAPPPAAPAPAAAAPEPAPPPEPEPAAAEPAPPPAPAPAPAAAGGPAIPPDITIPTDPVTKAAFDVLEKHCSRCHEAGMLTTREKPAKNFGDILKLDQLAANPHLIQAGNPEGSKLFQQIINKEMPYDVYYEFDTSKPEVTAADIEALRAWIKSTGDQEAAACATRKFVSEDDVVNAIAADLQSQPDHRVKGRRYLTLANIYNSCDSDEAMNVYRQGVVKLLNGFSRRSDVVRLETVDPAKTVVAFNLEDLGWTEADWNTVLANYPYATKPDAKMFDFTAQQTNAVLPYVRADWFTFTASQPPLYDKLLELPETFPGLTAKLGVDLDANIRNFVAQRSGFQKSGVSQNNRLIERHPISTGYFWTSYDFSGSRGKQSLFLHPLGPEQDGIANGFHHDGGESIFSLPNGFQAYYLNKSDGTRLDKGPTQIVRDPTRRDLSVTNGISCMGCHDQGMRKAKDEVRRSVVANKSFSKDVRDTVEGLYPETDKMDALIEDDFQRFNSAVKRAGLDPTLKLNGVEMTNALFKRYEDDLSLRRAAAEYGYAPDAFKEAFIQGGAEAIDLMRRLEQGIVPRDQFETLFIKFVETATDDSVVDVSNLAGGAQVAPVITPPSPGGTFELRLTADNTVYNQNQAAVFTAVASRDCSLFVVNVSKDGVGTIIFPNKFQADNAVKAGQAVVLGGPGSPFKFKLPDIGKERVVAVCRVNGSTREAFGYQIDPAKQTFAQIPNFEKQVTRSIVVEANDIRKEAAGLDADARKDAQNAKLAAVTSDKAGSAAPASSRETVASTAIVIQVQ